MHYAPIFFLLVVFSALRLRRPLDDGPARAVTKGQRHRLKWRASGYDARAVHARRLLAITGEIVDTQTPAILFFGSLTLLNLIVPTLCT